MCYRTYSKLYSFLSFLSEKLHECCCNVCEGRSQYLYLIQKLSKVIKDTLCNIYMTAFISLLGCQRYFVIFPPAQYCMNSKVSSRVFCYGGSGTKYIFFINVWKPVSSVESWVLTSHHDWEGIATAILLCRVHGYMLLYWIFSGMSHSCDTFLYWLVGWSECQKICEDPA